MSRSNGGCNTKVILENDVKIIRLLLRKPQEARMVDLGYCLHLVPFLFTHENSDTCQDVQNNKGCHACGRLGCYISAIDCHAKCTAKKHVCGSGDKNLGCDACGHMCHQNNADLRCPYYRKRRGRLTWSTTDKEQMDTQYRSQGSVPHMTRSMELRRSNKSRRNQAIN